MAYTNLLNFAVLNAKFRYQDANALGNNDKYIYDWFTTSDIAASYFTRDLTAASGDVSYTGIGFTPSRILFIGGISDSISWGVDSITEKNCCNIYLGAAISVSNNYSIIARTSASSNYQRAVVSSFDSDGFTLTWTKNNSPTGTATWQYFAMK